MTKPLENYITASYIVHGDDAIFPILYVITKDGYENEKDCGFENYKELNFAVIESALKASLKQHTGMDVYIQKEDIPRYNYYCADATTYHHEEQILNDIINDFKKLGAVFSTELQNFINNGGDYMALSYYEQ